MRLNNWVSLVEHRWQQNILKQVVKINMDKTCLKMMNKNKLFLINLDFLILKLSANEVRANSIIYAIARARKSSGRLNLDDIERAAQDLNIYGDSSVDVVTKIRILKQQLLGSRNDDLGQIQLIFPNYYKTMIEQGYGAYDGRVTSELVGSGIKDSSDDFSI